LWLFALEQKDGVQQQVQQQVRFSKIIMKERNLLFKHRCTVVGNPGGSLGILANSFEGGTWGCEKVRGGHVLLHFYVEVFQKSL
jgi:hypothetical protein